MKYCQTCGQTKSNTSFFTSKSTWDGYETKCKLCRTRAPKFTPQERHPNQVPGQLINKMAGVYKPDSSAAMRPGADDHINIKSRRCDQLVEQYENKTTAPRLRTPG